jgi:hypothetical protein
MHLAGPERRLLPSYSFDVASLPTTLIGSGVPRPWCGCAPRPSPDPPGSSWWDLLERRSAVGFCSYTFPSCLPSPDHLTVLARPVVVGLLSALSHIPVVRLPPASPDCCDSPAAVLSHHRTVSWRLVALEVGHPEPVWRW